MIIAKGIKIWGCVVVVIKSFCITGGFCITRFVIVWGITDLAPEARFYFRPENLMTDATG